LTQPWPATSSEKARGIPDRVIRYQYRHDRARRTLPGIDELLAKAECAVDGKAPIKRNRYIELSGATKSVNRTLQTKTPALDPRRRPQRDRSTQNTPRRNAPPAQTFDHYGRAKRARKANLSQVGSIWREPRRVDHTICTASAPEAVFTVRTQAARAPYEARFSVQISTKRRAKPQISVLRRRPKPKNVLSQASLSGPALT
jgi:hypothetical protein